MLLTLLGRHAVLDSLQAWVWSRGGASTLLVTRACGLSTQLLLLLVLDTYS